jgi:hypothetical protein
MTIDNKGGLEAEISNLVENARLAQTGIENYSQQKVDELVSAVCWSVVQPERARRLAKSAVDEGGFGDYEDKVGKIRNRCMGTLLDMQSVKTVGIVEEIPEKGLVKIAKPVGVVAALIPITGPDATPPLKTLLALKGRNAIIIAGHPRAQKTTELTVEFMREACRQVGAPEDLIQVVKNPSLAKTQELMKQADLAVIAMGVRPNCELAKTGGIALGQTGAIAVNSAMETRTPGIFAAGDCCETVNRITGKPVWMPLGDIANLQGRVAGENAAGGSAHFPGVFGTAIFKSFDLGVAMTGLSEQAALESGFDPVSVEMAGSDRARYYPGRRQFSFKLVADRRSGLVLGAQAIGTGTVDKMIDIVATALLGKLTCADLENADFAYSPPFSPVLSPVIVAAGALNKKLVS